MIASGTLFGPYEILSRLGAGAANQCDVDYPLFSRGPKLVPD
jgi:hypothetical protein